MKTRIIDQGNDVPIGAGEVFKDIFTMKLATTSSLNLNYGLTDSKLETML